MRIGQHLYSAATSFARGATSVASAIANKIASILSRFRSNVENIQGAEIKNPDSPLGDQAQRNAEAIARLHFHQSSTDDVKAEIIERTASAQPQIGARAKEAVATGTDHFNQTKGRKNKSALAQAGRRLVDKTKKVGAELATRVDESGAKMDTDQSWAHGKIKTETIDKHIDNNKPFNKKQAADIDANGGKIRDDMGKVTHYTYKNATIPAHLVDGEDPARKKTTKYLQKREKAIATFAKKHTGRKDLDAAEVKNAAKIGTFKIHVSGSSLDTPYVSAIDVKVGTQSMRINESVTGSSVKTAIQSRHTANQDAGMTIEESLSDMGITADQYQLVNAMPNESNYGRN